VVLINDTAEVDVGEAAYQTISYTFTLPADARELNVRFAFSPTGTAGDSLDGYTVSQIKLEEGVVATQFSRSGDSVGDELGLCQRYYEIGDVIQFRDTVYSASRDPVTVQFSNRKRIVPSVTMRDDLGDAGKVTIFSSTGAATTDGITGTSGQWESGLQVTKLQAINSYGISCSWEADAEL
jgi:hypothetical protein